MRQILICLLTMNITTACCGDELKSFANCKLVPTDWADGDSFLVEFPNGEQHTLRLYAVDCVEWHVNDPTDARRLRAQRRYFGISEFGGSPETSVAKAKEMAREAAMMTRNLLQKEFTVHTAFADGRGDGKHKRYYAFVETSEHEDLAELLVKKGLARAYGVFRGRNKDVSRDECEERLKDQELAAAKRGIGLWEFTNWDSLPKERFEERKEEAELAEAINPAANLRPGSINPNSAARDELMQLPGIGEVIAHRIIEGRESGPYSDPDDLSRIQGLGEKTIAKIRPYLVF